MNYEVVESIKAKTAAGNVEIMPIGAVLDIDPAKAVRLVKAGKLKPLIWSNPFPQGTPEARRESLLKIMGAVWTAKFQGIIKRVLGGEAKLADFNDAVEAWGRVCNEEIKENSHDEYLQGDALRDTSGRPDNRHEAPFGHPEQDAFHRLL